MIYNDIIMIKSNTLLLFAIFAMIATASMQEQSKEKIAYQQPANIQQQEYKWRQGDIKVGTKVVIRYNTLGGNKNSIEADVYEALPDGNFILQMPNQDLGILNQNGHFFRFDSEKRKFFDLVPKLYHRTNYTKVPQLHIIVSESQAKSVEYNADSNTLEFEFSNLVSRKIFKWTFLFTEKLFEKIDKTNIAIEWVKQQFKQPDFKQKISEEIEKIWADYENPHERKFVSIREATKLITQEFFKNNRTLFEDKLEEARNEMKEQFPDYAAANYSAADFTIEDVEKMLLDPDEALADLEKERKIFFDQCFNFEDDVDSQMKRIMRESFANTFDDFFKEINNLKTMYHYRVSEFLLTNLKPIIFANFPCLRNED